MKIACLIGSPPYLNHFVNEVSKKYHIDLVIRETTPIKGIAHKILEKGIWNTINILIYRLKTRRRFRRDCDMYFSDTWKSINNALAIYETYDINADSVVERIRELKPDIILVYGTSLVKTKVIENVPLVLNLHGGLSPYYRGSYCTEWALLNRDPENIGYTIHQLSDKIDGGGILTQWRVSILGDDTANRINMKLIKEGTQDMIRVLGKLQDKKLPDFQPQDGASGFLYLTSHWSFKMQGLVRKLEKEKLTQMLTKPSRKKLPIKHW